MQESDFEGIKRDGARARQQDIPYYNNPHYFDRIEDWLLGAAAWNCGWREADCGRDAGLATLDRIRTW